MSVQQSLIKSMLALYAVICMTNNASAQFSADHRGLTYNFEDRDIQLNLAGRFHLDHLQSSDGIFGDQTNIRRLRLDVTASFGSDWRVKIDRDFAPNREGWRNLWIQYRGLKGFRIKAGQFVTPFSLEEIMESNNLVFLDRALPGALASSFRIGGAISYAQDHWTVTSGIFINPINNKSTIDDGVSYILRGTFAPIRKKKHVLHFGAAIEHRNLDGDARSRISARQEVSLATRSLLNTRTIPDAAFYTTINLESAYINGPLLLQGQYLTRNTNIADANDVNFSGYYFQIAFLLNDANRRYSRSSGIIGSVQPKSKLGAYEIAARVSELDLDDGVIEGGKEQNFTAGMSWYVNRNFRVTANYIRIRLFSDRYGSDRSENVFQTRLQVRF